MDLAARSTETRLVTDNGVTAWCLSETRLGDNQRPVNTACGFCQRVALGTFVTSIRLTRKPNRFRVLTKPSRFPSSHPPPNRDQLYKVNFRPVRRARTELSLHQARRPPHRRPSWSLTPTADAGFIAVPAASLLSAPEFNQNTHSLQLQKTLNRLHRSKLHRAIRKASPTYSTRS